MPTPRPAQIRASVPHYASDLEIWYTAFHAPRYAMLLALLGRYVPENAERILDIGSRHLTELIHVQFGLPVDTLGFPEDGLTATGYHYSFDLNETQWRERWRTDLPRYDVIVMAEVLEHLHTSPRLVLNFLGSLLKPHGLLILQTPNAAALGKRARLLFGLNPYHLIGEDVSNPHHFREYTEGELRMYASKTNFEVLDVILASYFDMRYKSLKAPPTTQEVLTGFVQNIVYPYLPRNLQSGITLVMSPN
jgi:SAM-dependent methyltransferase